MASFLFTQSPLRYPSLNRTVKFGTTTLQQVLHVPGLQCNLLAVNKVPPKLFWSFSNTEGKLLDQSTNKVHLSAPFKNGAYSLQNGITS
ncbi:hypothetical protein C345_01192 [Cryptococcus neoformans A2-102-5]|nr:hypothetical protein C354_00396 [Cryptococcus neoformans var. grubii MW-RSA1955]OXG98605.1 hypothetical protein C345_01192 [Cryptococcus neoformans var. grubii A2-102-5]